MMVKFVSVIILRQFLWIILMWLFHVLRSNEGQDNWQEYKAIIEAEKNNKEKYFKEGHKDIDITESE